MGNPVQRIAARLRRRWKAAAVLIILAAGGAALGASPALRERTHESWHRILVWAGMGGVPGSSDTMYWCPMHPQIKSTKPNSACPICNMALVELEGGDTKAPEHLTLTARQVQQAGVASGPVVRRELYREIDTTGRIAYDERRLAKITSWVQGKSRIEKLYVSFMGQEVKQGEPLAELYSPELIAAQQEYLSQLDGAGARSRTGLGRDLLASVRQKLKYQGLTEAQIDRLQETREVVDRIPIYSPISGTVLERHAAEGQYVSEGDVLFEIADLSHLWLFVDVFEDEISLVDVGHPVELTVRSFPSETFTGRVSFIGPMVMSESRVVRVRVDVPNPNGKLKPGMYARAQLRKEFSEILAVPEAAVLWSGQRAIAIVEAGDGIFVPREVEIGRRWLYAADATPRPAGELEFGRDRERYHEVLAGLFPGEQVVMAGTFLLSAESQVQGAMTKMLPPREHRVTLEEAVGTELAAGIRELLDRYYALSGALAEDQLSAATAAFEAVAEAADSLAQRAEQENASRLAGQASQLADDARDVTAHPPGDLHAARTGFGRVSRSMVRLLAQNGGQTLFGRDLFLFRCGMAKVGYENWLWWSEEKFNPYMGQKMLTCGSKLDVLKP